MINYIYKSLFLFVIFVSSIQASTPDVGFVLFPNGVKNLTRIARDVLLTEEFLELQSKYLTETISKYANTEWTLEDITFPLTSGEKSKFHGKVDFKLKVSPEILSISILPLESRQMKRINGRSLLMALKAQIEIDNNIPVEVADIVFEITNKSGTKSYLKVASSSLEASIFAKARKNEKVKIEITYNIFLDSAGVLKIELAPISAISNLEGLSLDIDSLRLEPFLETSPTKKGLIPVAIKFWRQKLLNVIQSKFVLNKVIKRIKINTIEEILYDLMDKTIPPIINEIANKQCSTFFPLAIKIPITDILKDTEEIGVNIKAPFSIGNGIIVGSMFEDRINDSVNYGQLGMIKDNRNDFALFLNTKTVNSFIDQMDLNKLVNNAIPPMEGEKNKRIIIDFIEPPSIEKSTDGNGISLKTHVEVEMRIAILGDSIVFVDDAIKILGSRVKGDDQKIKDGFWRKIPVIGNVVNLARRVVGVSINAVGELSGAVIDEIKNTGQSIMRVVGKESFIEIPARLKMELSINNPEIIFSDSGNFHQISISVSSADDINLNIQSNNITTDVILAPKLEKGLGNLLREELSKLLETVTFDLPAPRYLFLNESKIEATTNGNLYIKGRFDSYKIKNEIEQMLEKVDLTNMF